MSRPSTSLGACGIWPIHAIGHLQPDHTLTDPAIIEAETTTALVDTGDRVTVNELGWLDIEPG